LTGTNGIPSARHEHERERKVRVFLNFNFMRDSLFERPAVAARQPVQSERDKGGYKPLYAAGPDEHVEIVRRVAARYGKVALLLADDLMDRREGRPRDVAPDKKEITVIDKLPTASAVSSL
jgi:hypothetical protein